MSVAPAPSTMRPKAPSAPERAALPRGARVVSAVVTGGSSGARALGAEHRVSRRVLGDVAGSGGRAGAPLAGRAAEGGFEAGVEIGEVVEADFERQFGDRRHAGEQAIGGGAQTPVDDILIGALAD